MTEPPISEEHLLRPSLLKIGWAEHHINDLNARIQEYLAQKPIRLMTVGDPNANKETHIIEKHAPIPDEFALIIGDAVHNLRSALDLLMFGMVGHRATNPNAVQFPFAWRQERLVCAIKSRQAHLAGEKVVEQTKALKPYAGGDRWIHGLHVLDVSDKHKLVIPVASTASMTLDDFKRLIPHVPLPDRSGTISIHESASIISDYGGSRSDRRANRRNIRPGKYERNLQPSFEISFDSGQPFAQEPVIPVLAILAGEVRKACEKLARAFVG